MKVYVPPNFQNLSFLSIIYLASIVTPFYSFSVPHIEIFFNPSSGGRRVCVCVCGVSVFWVWRYLVGEISKPRSLHFWPSLRGGGLDFEGMFNWIFRVSRRIIHLNQQSTFEISQHNRVICSHGSEFKYIHLSCA